VPRLKILVECSALVAGNLDNQFEVAYEAFKFVTSCILSQVLVRSLVSQTLFNKPFADWKLFCVFFSSPLEVFSYMLSL